MSINIVLPQWKRFDTKFINLADLNPASNGSAEAYRDYADHIAKTLNHESVIGNIDGYITRNGSHLNPYVLLDKIDAEKQSNHLFKLMKLDTDNRGKFHSMDDIFLQIDRSYLNGFSMHVKSSPDKPVVEFVKSTQHNSLMVHHDLIMIEPETNMTLLRIIKTDNTALIFDNVEVYLGKGSTLNYVTLNKSRHDSFYTAIKRAVVGEHARINWYNIDLEAVNTVISTRSMLYAPYGESRMLSVIIGSGDAQKDVSYETFHRAPRTSTSVHVRAAIRDNSRLNYRALTYVAPGAKNSKVEQAEKAITLGNTARFDGIPSLWIDEDEVEASHSASSGSVDEDAMFYIKSRGIPRDEAENLVVQGFISSVLNKEPVSLLSGLF